MTLQLPVDSGSAPGVGSDTSLVDSSSAVSAQQGSNLLDLYVEALRADPATVISTSSAAIAALAAVFGILLSIVQIWLTRRAAVEQRASERYDLWVTQKMQVAVDTFRSLVEQELQGDDLKANRISRVVQSLGVRLVSAADAIGNDTLRSELREAAQDLEDEMMRAVVSHDKNLQPKLEQAMEAGISRIARVVSTHSP